MVKVLVSPEFKLSVTADDVLHDHPEMKPGPELGAEIQRRETARFLGLVLHQEVKLFPPTLSSLLF